VKKFIDSMENASAKAVAIMVLAAVNGYLKINDDDAC
jgi:hypothetical protein